MEPGLEEEEEKEEDEDKGKDGDKKEDSEKKVTEADKLAVSLPLNTSVIRRDIRSVKHSFSYLFQ